MESDTYGPATEYDRRNVTGSGPYQVELAARLREVRFADRCVRCAAPSAASVPLVKLFWRARADDTRRQVIETVAVPVCAACAAEHAGARRAPDPAVLRRLRNRFLLRTLPYWVPIGVIVWLLVQMGPAAIDGMGGDDPWERLLWLGVVLFFGLCLAMFVRLVLVARHGLVAEQAGGAHDGRVEIVRGPLGITCVLPAPPTPVLAAVDFGDEDDALFERSRRTFTFANLDVATEFAAVNVERVHDPNAPAAIRARWARTALGVLVVGAGVVLWLWDVLGF